MHGKDLLSHFSYILYTVLVSHQLHPLTIDPSIGVSQLASQFNSEGSLPHVLKEKDCSRHTSNVLVAFPCRPSVYSRTCTAVHLYNHQTFPIHVYRLLQVQVCFSTAKRPITPMCIVFHNSQFTVSVSRTIFLFFFGSLALVICMQHIHTAINRNYLQWRQLKTLERRRRYRRPLKSLIQELPGIYFAKLTLTY